MTILFADGFEDCDATEYAASGITVGATNGRRGGKAIRAETWQNLVFSFAGATTMFFHFAGYIPTLPSSSNITIAHFREGGTAHVWLELTPAGAIRVIGSGVQLGITAGGVITAGGYTSFEVKIVSHDTTGSVEIRLNGSSTPVIALTNVDTRNSGAGLMDNFQWSGAFLGNAWIDDVVIWDTTGSVNNNWMGDLRVDSYMPTGDGDSATMTTSSGTDHYALVDEIPASGTDYVQGGTVGNKDLYQMADMTHTPASIKAVVPVAKLLKDDAGTRSGCLVVKSGSTESDGSNIAPSTASVKYARVLETDPNGGGAWSKAAVDALQVGVKVTV